MTATALGAAERASLSREMHEFLIELSTAMQRHAIYPRGHPLVTNADDAVLRRLDSLLRGRDVLTIGVAKEQLIIDGVSTDPAQPLLRDLSWKIHRHQIGAVKILPGIARTELADLLGVISGDPEQAERSLGPVAEQLRRWPHARLHLLRYERLSLAEETFDGPLKDENRPTKVWLALARAGMGAGETDELTEVDAVDLARAIEEHEPDPAYDQLVVSCLLEITDALRQASGVEAETLRHRVSELLRAMRPETLRQLLALGGDVEQRKKLVLEASHEVAVEAVLSLVKAAADASGKTISASMLRLLSKFALQAEEGTPLMRAGATQALRDHVEGMVERWDDEAPAIDPYRQALDRMARLRMLAVMRKREHPCEPRRLVELALETDTIGPPVWRALSDMLTGNEIAVLLDLLDRAPDQSAISAELWARVATAEHVGRMLRGEQVDLVLLDRLAARMGETIIDPLLDALETAESRATRRKLLDLLAAFGASTAQSLVSRLEIDPPWYVQRNLLTLLQRVPELPRPWSPLRQLQHPDARVRREAFKLALRVPSRRDDAVTVALADRDERVVQLAIQAAAESCPVTAVPVIVRRLEDNTMPETLRVSAIRAAAPIETPITLNWLLRQCAGKRSWFGRRKLASKSPEMLAALQGLLTWREDPRAAAVLGLASRESDAEIRAVLRSRKS